MKKIELVLWYKCNAKCAFCASRSMGDGSFSTEEAAGVLAGYRRRGAEETDFGGGEPTVREDLPVLLQAAKKLGYSHVGIKSNGMRFCYPEYAGLCMESGADKFSVSIWGWPPREHDRLAGREGAFEMTEMGLKHLVDLGADVHADILLTGRSAPALDGLINQLALDVGVRKFHFWLYSIFGSKDGNSLLLPRMSEAAECTLRALKSVGNAVERASTTHLMPCVLGDRRDIYYNLREEDLTIVTPGHSFQAEESPFEAGVHVKACRGCKLNSRCPGPRPEYVKIHGDSEFKPVK